MERDEAINIIKIMKLMLIIEDGIPKSDLYHALETAEEALKGPDILKVSFAREADKEMIENIKKTMANAPIMIMACEKEIVHCEDCESWQTDWSYRDIGGTVEYHYCSVMDVATPLDGYCYQGEKKE